MNKLKSEMINFLKGQFGSEAEEFDMEEAIYWFAANYHEGQWSDLYSILSTSDFRPGRLSNGPEQGMCEMMYDALVEKYGQGEEPIDESMNETHTHRSHETRDDDGSSRSARKPKTRTCPECEREFDLLDPDDASEWYNGHDCEVFSESINEEDEGSQQDSPEELRSRIKKAAEEMRDLELELDKAQEFASKIRSREMKVPADMIKKLARKIIELKDKFEKKEIEHKTLTRQLETIQDKETRKQEVEEIEQEEGVLSLPKVREFCAMYLGDSDRPAISLEQCKSAAKDLIRASVHPVKARFLMARVDEKMNNEEICELIYDMHLAGQDKIARGGTDKPRRRVLQNPLSTDPNDFRRYAASRGFRDPSLRESTEASEFERDPRGYALSLVEGGLVSEETFIIACLKFMSHDDVREMLDANELSPRFSEDEESPEEDDDEDLLTDGSLKEGSHGKDSGRIMLDCDVYGGICKIVDLDTDKDIFVQTDYDAPSVAGTFGWNIRDVQKDEKDPCDHRGTDGSVDCRECGVTASEFISSAIEWIDNNDGAQAENPGYTFDD